MTAQHFYFGAPNPRCWAHALTCSDIEDCPYEDHECYAVGEGPLGLCERHREELVP